MRPFMVDKLIDGLDVISTTGKLPEKVVGITQDSRLVEDDFIFAARSGSKASAGDFIPQAVANGAVLVITGDDLPQPQSLPVVKVADFRHALEIVSKRVYRDPSTRLKLICVTGTNGKTTSVHLIKSILTEAGEVCGMLSTVGYDTIKRRIKPNLTTPDIDLLNAMLAEMVDAGAGWAVMEASSHALQQGRLAGLHIHVGAFTNLTHEHLDFHGSLKEYADAKAKLFAAVEKDGLSVINRGDKWSKTMIDAARGRIITYRRCDGDADLKVKIIEQSLDGGRFRLKWGEDVFEAQTTLIGEYNAENVALAAGVTLGLGFSPAIITKGVAKLKRVPGRMEAVNCGQPFSVLVDYSHTPDALKNALATLKSLCHKDLIVVFGCGGDRDRSKRPEMGRVAVEIADRLVITNDNPRSEEPGIIAGEIMNGVPTRRRNRAMVELDRREAIRRALISSREGDIILIAGKGHENYQLISGKRHNFDDRKVAAELLARLGWNKGNTQVAR